MKTNLPTLVIVTAAILGLSAIGSAFSAAGRYAMHSANTYVYVLDRFTGDLRECTGGVCETVTRTATPKR